MLVMLLIGWLVRECSQQLSKIGKTKFMSFEKKEQDAFEEISSSIYKNDSKSDGELNLGLALLALINYQEEPEEWDDMSVAGMLDKLEQAEAYFCFKYADEIKGELGAN